METDQILDLFNLGETASLDPSSSSTTGVVPSSSAATTGAAGGALGEAAAGREEDMVDVVNGEVREKGKKGWLDGLGELWDEKGYEEEYNLDSFLASMKV